MAENTIFPAALEKFNVANQAVNTNLIASTGYRPKGRSALLRMQVNVSRAVFFAYMISSDGSTWKGPYKLNNGNPLTADAPWTGTMMCRNTHYYNFQIVDPTLNTLTINDIQIDETRDGGAS